LIEITLSTEAVIGLGGRGVRPLTAASQQPSGEEAIPPALLRAALSLERRWTTLVLGPGANGNLYRNLFGEAVAISLAAIEDTAVATRQLLNAIDPLRALPDATEPQIRSALAPISGPSSIAGVVVYDVGQGGANGLTAAGRV